MMFDKINLVYYPYLALSVGFQDSSDLVQYKLWIPMTLY